MILMYHKVAPESPTMWWVYVDEFRRQMLELRDRKVVYLDDYDPANPDHVVITFDGVYRNVLEFAAPVLLELGYPFELFITGDYIGRNNYFDTPEPVADFAGEAELRHLIDMGGRLQWHGNAHLNLGKVGDVGLITRELDIPQQIRALDSNGFRWLAYPHGAFNAQTLELVRQRFVGALSCHQGNNTESHQLNRLTVTNKTVLRRMRISVIIACHNYGIYLPEAVESALHQTLLPDEILISDDASTDDTQVVMEIMSKKYGDRLRYHRNEENLGIVRHFNAAVAMTSGDYICFLGADNRMRSDYLEHTVGALDRNPRAAIAYTDFALFGPRARIVGEQYSKIWPVRNRMNELYEVQFPDFDETSKVILLERRNFIHGSSLFRRSAFREVGGYRESARPEDWNLFRRMVEMGWEAVHCPHALLEYRQHSRQQANVRLESETALKYYREAYSHACARADRLNTELVRIRSTLTWKLATPFRIMENLLRKCL